jgi:predicted RNase H-like HicB family nuclease
LGRLEPCLGWQGKKEDEDEDMDVIRYAAVLEHSENGYSAFFPDLPGCASGGDDLEQAITNASEALALHLAGMVEDGEPLPKPTPFDQLVIDQDVDMRAMVLVEARPPGRKVRINVMIDAKLLEDIDAVASNRSQFLSNAAREALVGA